VNSIFPFVIPTGTLSTLLRSIKYGVKTGLDSCENRLFSLAHVENIGRAAGLRHSGPG
jgi:hypothetical protein